MPSIKSGKRRQGKNVLTAMSRELSGNILRAFYFWQDGFQRIYFDKPRFWLEAATRERAHNLPTFPGDRDNPDAHI